MATTRLFIGELSPGDYRARISQPGYDASNPSLPRERLQFDTSWPFAGNIHAIIAVPGGPSAPPSPNTVMFPALPFVPAVQVVVASQNTLTTDFNRRRIELGRVYGVNGPSSPIRWTAYSNRVVITRDKPLIYNQPAQISCFLIIVWRVPARLLSNEGVGTARMLIGKRGASYGIYSSRSGEDVRTCQASMLTFSSDDVPLQIKATVFGERLGQQDNANTTTATVLELFYPDVGYAPLVLAFMSVADKNGSNLYMLPWDRLQRMNSEWNWVSGGYNPAATFTHLGVGHVSEERSIRFSIIVFAIPFDDVVPT